MTKIRNSKHPWKFEFKILDLFKISKFGFRASGKSGAGFTLLEVLIVFAIIGLLAAFGIVIGIDSYQRYNVRAERDLIVSLLEKARSEAVNNIGAQPHGLHFDPASPAQYVLFRGNTFSAGSSFNLSLPRSQAVTVSGLTDIVFTQLGGVPTVTPVPDIAVTGVHTHITINAEGGMNW